jgi:adenylate cyclase
MALAISLLIGMASYTTFIYGKITMPTVIPLITIGFKGLTFLVVGTISIQRERSALRRTLEQYVAAPIVNEILSQPEDFRRLLRGKNVQAAVLFCDIRGFTALSTQLPADQLISQLNTYLEKMVDAILSAQGTVDKFIGDAIMAEFGSPISQGEKEDAMNAIRAALQMRSHLVELRSQWDKSGNVPFFNGIGIHYGEITVGNIGSPKRLEYAAIGDTVNLASRVEGMTKVFGVDILITEALYRIVREEVTVIAFGEHTVKGRSQTVNLYALVDLKGNDDTLFAQVRTQTQNYLPKHNNL